MIVFGSKTKRIFFSTIKKPPAIKPPAKTNLPRFHRYFFIWTTGILLADSVKSTGQNMSIFGQFWRRLTTASDPRTKLLEIPSSTAVGPTFAVDIVKSALDRALLPQIVALVVIYAKPTTYTWSTKPYFPTILAIDNQITLRSFIDPVGSWTRIVATQTVGKASTRWRILTEFGSNGSRMAVGVTSATTINRQGAMSWQTAALPTDFLISTQCHNPAAVAAGLDANLMIGGVVANSGVIKRNARAAVTLIAVDADKRTMTATFRDYGGSIRDVVVPLPTVTDWRPCVILFGAVQVAILPFLDCL